jgi:crossover junction endodeoxyribonuclease RuvC
VKLVTSKVVIGIDPGLTGAIAFIPEDWAPWVEDMPVTAHGKRKAVDVVKLANMLDPYRLFGNATAYLERVHAFPGQGVSSMFSLGMSFWGVAGVLAACGIPFHLITPADWKARLDLDRDKEKSLALARNLFPGVDLSRKKHHGRAEALLIAHYGKRWPGPKS